MLKKLLIGTAAFAAFAFVTIPLPAVSYTEDPQVHAGTKIIPERDCSGRHAVCTVRVTVNFNDGNIKNGLWFATLPKNAFITAIDVQTTVAWNAATTNVLTVGTTRTSANEVIADGASATANISNNTTTIATGVLHLSAALGIGLTITGNATYQTAVNGGVPLYVKYTQTGTAATTGSTTIVFSFVLNDDM